jgi:glycosyltransferase involved in cell wall biosynthesis
MKIAMLTSVGEGCGIAAYTAALVDGLRTLTDTDVVVVPISVGRQPTAHYIEQAKQLNAADIDVVHIQHEHSFWGGIMPRASAFWEMRYLIKKPVVITAHTTYSLEHMFRVKSETRPIKLLVKKVLLRNTAYRQSVDTAPFVSGWTIVHTSAARNELIQRGVQPDYVTVVPTGVPPATPSLDGGAAFKAKYALEGCRVLTLFGYLAPNKGYELTFKIIPALPPDIRIVIAGGPRTADMEPYAAQIRALAEEPQIKGRVVITGYLSDSEVADAMAASDLVLTPHTEATGSYSVMLPITHGKPILASTMDCFQEIYDRSGSIALFKAGDTADFTAKVTRLLENDAERIALGEKAARYAERFAWPKVAAATRRVYESAIQVYSAGHHDHSH